LDQTEKTIAINKKIRALELTSAEEELKFRNEDLETRNKTLEMNTSLIKQGGAATTLEVINARSRYMEARFLLSQAERNKTKAEEMVALGELTDATDLVKAQSQYASAKLEFEQTKNNLDQFDIKSPIDGFIDYGKLVELRQGVIIRPFETLTQVSKLDPIHVVLDFPQERLDDLFMGQKAEVVLDSFPKETFSGQVVRISPQVNSQLRVLPVTVALNNPNGRIKAGITGYARLKNTKKATLIPATALIEQGDKAVVFTVEDGRAHLRDVRAGHATESGLVEIYGGLKPGEEIVVFNNFYRDAGKLTKSECYLQDNDPVDVDWRAWARRE
jgi:RND family efflux transporter MFP subunit